MEHKNIACEFAKEDITEEGIFKGYGSLSDNKPDAYGDVILFGAFSRSLKENGHGGHGIAMMSQHGRESSNPIGVWLKLSENKTGLKVEGKLAIGELETQLARDIYVLMKIGALTGLSIGYAIYKDGAEWDDKRNVRILKEIDLWEISPVTFPAKSNTRITNVKSIREAHTERELEMALREAGLSKNTALYLVKLARPALRESRHWEDIELASILNSLKQANKNIQKEVI